MPFPGPSEAIDSGADPFEILAHAKQENDAVMEAQKDFLTELLRWLIGDADDPRAIGLRVLVAAHALQPDLGKQLFSMLPPDTLAQLEQEFETSFRGPLAGSPRQPRAGAAGLYGETGTPSDD